MSTKTPSIDFEKLFDKLPDHYFVIEPRPPYTFLAANRAYYDMVGMSAGAILGRPLFEVFPDTSPRALKTGKGELETSIEHCIKTKKPDAMNVIRYDIPDAKGRFSLHYWQVTHYPILDEAKKVIAVVQSATDVTEMVLANEQLHISQLQLDDVLSAGMIGSWIWDVEANNVRADKGLAMIFGMNPEEVKSGLEIEFFTKTIHPTDRERVEAAITKALSSKHRFESEYRITTPSGEERWVIARGRVEHDAHGKAVSFPGVMIDITARKQAEAAQLHTEERLRFMADSMPQLVWVANSDGKVEYYNQRWYEFTGTTPDDLVKGDLSYTLHPDDRAHMLRAWKHSLKTGELYEVQYRLYHAETNSYRWVIGRALPYKDDGTIYKWYGTCTDIDEQKRAMTLQTFLADVSKELSSSLDYTETLKKVSQLCVPDIADWCSVDLYHKDTGWDQVSVAHADAKKVNLAREYRKLNPISIDDPGGVSQVLRTGEPEFYSHFDAFDLSEYITDKDVLSFMESLHIHSLMMLPLSINNQPAGVISFISSDSGRYYSEADFMMAKELASRISLTMSNVTLYESSQSELTIRKTLEQELRQEKQKLESRVKERTKQLQETNKGLRGEIMKRHKAERELKEQSKSLEMSNRELQDFAYVASHDLQEPLRKIQAFGNLLESEYGQELGEGADYLARMRGAAARMSVLIEDLLEFSRVTTKAHSSVPVDLNVVAEEVVSDLEARIKDTNGTVVVGKLPVVMADPTHMRQLLQNLIGNALKFHKPGEDARVEVSSTDIGGEQPQHEIRVQDNGIGFDEKYIDRIFSVFQRLHGKDDYDGTGIGLAVCRKIVERYGGKITAESKKDVGSTFIIVLPQAVKE